MQLKSKFSFMCIFICFHKSYKSKSYQLFFILLLFSYISTARQHSVQSFIQRVPYFVMKWKFNFSSDWFIVQNISLIVLTCGYLVCALHNFARIQCLNCRATICNVAFPFASKIESKTYRQTLTFFNIARIVFILFRICLMLQASAKNFS